jgi:tetratricopeptide (TPR) repeat protein
MLLGDAQFARAGNDVARLEATLAHYDRLLGGLPADSPTRFRILYQKGLTLERLDGRADDALIAYMDAIQSAPESPRGDWAAIESCGFAALRILEKREEWVAAMKLARRIAALGGPRAEDATERAKRIGMEQFIYEE